MTVETSEKFPITAKESPQFVEHQDQDRGNKHEAGLSEEQVETLKQVSSLVAMFQQEALNEKQTRLLAQLKALEKDRLATDAWKIIAALKKEKGDLEIQVEKLKAQNNKLTTDRVLPRCYTRFQVNPCEMYQTDVKLPETINDKNNRIKDELSKLFVKDITMRTIQDGDKALKEQQTEPSNAVDAIPVAVSGNKESSQTADTRTQDVIKSEENSSQKSPVTPPQEFRDPVAGVCGLENLGNTCFVNAGLQCLFSVTSFRRFFLGGGHKTVTRKGQKENQLQPLLSKSLGDLVNDVWSGLYHQCDPSELYKAVTAHFPYQLSRQRQHDCHELLALFLDGIHQELNCASLQLSSTDQSNNSQGAEERWRQYTMSNESLIVDTFQGQLQSRITCAACSHESVKYQPFTFLSVPLLSESYHTFVITWVSCDIKNTGYGNALAVRYKVQVTKPSTVLKLKTNFLSLLSAEKQAPQINDIIVSVVRNSQIVSIMDDEKQLTPFADRRSKLYILKPSCAPESLYVKDNDTKRISFFCPTERNSTMYYSPEVASTSEFMSALDELQIPSPVSKYHHNRLASPNTSTPKAPPHGQRTRASLLTVYRLSATCCICLEEKTDHELIPHDKCGSVFCRQCLQDAAGGAIENHLSCPKCAKQAAITQSRHDIERDRSREDKEVITILFGCMIKTKRLFGHPNLIILPKNIRGKDVYSFIAKLLPEPLRRTGQDSSSPPFTLHLVDQQGRNCSRCTKITGCSGCQVNNDTTLNLQSCDNLAVQLTNIGRWDAERMSRCTEHESVWKPRNTEDPLQLHNCLKKFVDSEKLPDTWFCQKCHEERTAFKCLSVCRLPDTLIIHLKRYSQNGAKVTAPVEFPLEELDMREYTHLEGCKTEQCLYDLIGCICHQGSYSSGHYTAYTNTNGVWYQYDDNQVTKEKPSSSCYAQAYMLFYHRRAVPALSTSASESPGTSEDNYMALSEETENTESEGDVFQNVPQSTANQKETLKVNKEELVHKLDNVKHSDCRSSPTNGRLLLGRIKRNKLKIKQKRPEKKAIRQARDPKFNGSCTSEACEDTAVSKCSCKQCEYLKLLEKQIKKAKLCSGEENPLKTAKKGDVDSVKSSLTSVSQSVSTSLSPTAEHTCSTVSASEGPECSYPKAAVQVTQDQNNYAHHKSSDDGKNLLEAETLSERLKCAIENENIRRAVTLLKRGADANVLVNGLSALHTAVGLESPLNVRFTRLLLDYGGDPDVPSADGLTPIHVAAMWNRVNCLKLMIDRGGNPYQEDKDGLNALKLAKAFEADTSADTSDFLAKLDDRISEQLKKASLSFCSQNSNISLDSNPSPQFSHVRCNLPVRRLGKRVSVRTVTRKVSRNFRRASGRFRRGIGRIRSLLSS